MNAERRPTLTRRALRRWELEAAGVLMQLANLAGNRFLPERDRGRRVRIGAALTARVHDAAMRGADGARLLIEVVAGPR